MRRNSRGPDDLGDSSWRPAQRPPALATVRGHDDPEHDAGLSAHDHVDPAARAEGLRERASASRGPMRGRARANFAEVADNADRLAAALTKLGCQPGDRVGTFCWNTQEHLEAYFAIPCIGAVLHTLNIRLFPEQLAYVINHGEDKIVILDDSLIPLLARVVDELQTVEKFIVDRRRRRIRARRPRDPALPRAPRRRGARLRVPGIDERAAAAMCYTSGTTGNPKGVAYSHRSSYLHSLVATTPAALGLVRARPRARDRAAVPRERMGHPVRGVPLRRVARDARAASCRLNR